MGNLKGLTSLTAIVVMIVAGGCEADRASTKRAYGERSAQIDRGAALFAQHCRHCHGEKGSGGHMTAPLVNHNFAFGSGEEELMATIRQGRPQGMPAFGGSLDEDQIEALASYVRWLQ